MAKANLRKYQSLLASLGLMLILSLAAVFWLKSEYPQTRARQLALNFHQLLKAGNFQAAHELTLKHGGTGNNPAELAKFASRQCLNADQFAYSFPSQTNGNRLRRWLSGREVEMEKVSIELENPCLLEIRLQYVHGDWKVSYFASHAG